MKVVILAGGFGTRLAEKTELLPKPMVEIGGRPIIWHIMKHYAHFGFREFIVALGYKGEVIKHYFYNYSKLMSDFTVHLASGDVLRREVCQDDWTIHLIDTGANTMTGGRLKRLASVIGQEPFMMTYGDAVCNVDLQQVLAFHRRHGKLATVTAVRPPARFGSLEIQESADGPHVVKFSEKPLVGEGWINGGYFVFEPKSLAYIAGDETSLERDPMEALARDGQLLAYQHGDFWQCMDTIRDVRLLEGQWSAKQAQWKVWP